MSTPERPDVERLRAALDRLGDEAEWPEVDAERLFSAMHGDLEADERRAVVDELIRNPRAAAVWRLARDLQPDDVPAQAPARARPWAWMSLAATLLLTVGAAWHFQPWRTDVAVYRSVETRSIASLLPEGTPLSRTQPDLRWTAIEGARYRVRVLTPDLDVLEESDDLDTPTYRVAPGVLRAHPSRRPDAVAGRSDAPRGPTSSCRRPSARRCSDA